jgi:hypothetical protein
MADGSVRYLFVYRVLVTMFQDTHELVACGSPGGEPLVGRDLINQHVITLDGPALLVKL